MPYGMTLSSLILDFCVRYTLATLPTDKSTIKHIHYVDDLAQLAQHQDDFFDLNQYTAPQGLPLTTEDFADEDEATFYGVTLSDGAKYISYSHDRWQKLLNTTLPPEPTLRDLLSVVALITHQPDLLPPFVEPCKNLLQSRIAVAANNTHWDAPADKSLIALIKSFLDLCSNSELPVLQRHIDVNIPIKIYTDASAYCIALVAYQKDQPVLLRQQVLSPRAKDLYHTNTKELHGIAFAIETLRRMEIDRRVHFNHITIYTDNTAAQSIVLNQRVSSVHGKQTIHLLKTLRYLQDITDDNLGRFTILHCTGPSNRADVYTRHPLLALLTNNDHYNDINFPPTTTNTTLSLMAIKRPASVTTLPSAKHPRTTSTTTPLSLPTTTCPPLDTSLLEILRTGATVNKNERQQLLHQLHHDYGHEGATTVNKRVRAFKISWPNVADEINKLTKQ
ncbi:hypothetical protein FOL47_003180, partial [Perkinsus chesapeaki]